MKNLFTLLSIFFLTTTLLAQKCESYFPQEVNKKYEYKDYNKRNKEIGTKVKTVISKKDIPGGIAVTIKEENKAKGADSTNTTESTIKCENGQMIMDMGSMVMNSEKMKAYQGMETKVDADNMIIPENVKAGDVLGKGKVVVGVYNQDVKIVDMTFNISDRKVEAIEPLTTDAGTFECIKVTSHVEFKMIMTFKTTITEWYSKNIGIVKSETLNKRGKVISSTVLTKID